MKWIPPPLPPSVDFMTATITLTSAQILALSVTPVEIVAAPPPGSAINVVGYTAKLHFGTVAYLDGNELVFAWGDPANNDAMAAVTSALVTSGADNTQIGQPPNRFGMTDISPNIDGQALSLFNPATPYDTGDGTLTVTVIYVITATQ